ncbi:hypothetical protein J7F02_28290 [Streptomyces sp. ISL-112]|uniref:hypothetical protein n=1 Tax=unclassified Streptomyces TaxID=2593676 RepID=UPI001BE82769|nr:MULTISPECIES: hypothetical protein [unclassified Streptomyces]MBT2429410.1 hypothetical protein [Streptomyces sp. ISL-112]MBT2464002.1 hypothetical protein [Streptomyces sp. ISL-63]
MTLDAMDWVWKHSRSKGNTRIALLFVADQVRTSAAEARLGHRALMAAMNATSKGTVEAALKKAMDLGELEVKEVASGRRAAVYRLPKAVGYARETSGSAPISGAQDSGSAPETGAQDVETAPASAPKTGAQSSACAPVFDASAPKNGAPPHTQTTQASEPAPEPDAFTRCQPLVQAMTEAGITVSWSMKPSDWLDIAAIIQRAGVPAMVAFARDTKASARQPVRYATFFLRGGWRGLPPVSNVPPPRPASAAGKRPHCGHPDCDPITRTREVENDRGLRNLHPCPDCHPTAKGQAA